jgi:zinc protease
MKRLAGIVFCSLFVALLPAQTAHQKKLVAANKVPVKKPAETTTSDYRDLKFPPLGEVKIPDIPTYTLPNGIKLYLLENHELPLVSGFALVHTGSLFDPTGKVGLAEIMGAVMRTGGTKSRTGDEIDQEVENIAASVESAVSPSNGKVSFSCLRENTAQVLSIFKDVLTAPEFRQEKIDLVKNQIRGGIARRNDDASGIAGREFARILYGPNTPYGDQTEYADLDNIQRPDLAAFYKRFYFPANTVIAVQGDFDSGEMKSQIEKLFADWTVKQPPAPPLPAMTAKPAPGVFIADKSDVTQTFFNVGHIGGDLRDKNYPALEVMTDILGGGFSSRLFKKVRTQLGYAYNISSDTYIGSDG